MTTTEAIECTQEAVFSDCRIPCALPRGHGGPHRFEPGVLDAPPHMATAYHCTVHEFRRTLMAAAEGWEKATAEYLQRVHEVAAARRNGNPDTFAPPAVRDAYAGSLMAMSYSYTLAAVLAVAERKFGKDVAEHLACVADEILNNGDDEDYNADVKPGAPMPPPTPVEQEHAGQLRLGAS